MVQRRDMLKRDKALLYSAQSMIPSVNPQRQSLRPQSIGFHKTLPSDCSYPHIQGTHHICQFLHRLFSSMTKLRWHYVRSICLKQNADAALVVHLLLFENLLHWNLHLSIWSKNNLHKVYPFLSIHMVEQMMN